MKKFKIKNFTKSAFVMIMLMFTSVFNAFAQNPGSVDQTFNVSGFSANVVHHLFPLSDGKYLTSFDFNGGYGFRRLNSDGSIDPSFVIQQRGKIMGMDTLQSGNIVAQTSNSPDFTSSNGQGIYVLSKDNDTIVGQVSIQSNTYIGCIKVINASQFPIFVQDYVAYTSHDSILLANINTSSTLILPLVVVPGNVFIRSFRITDNGKIFIATSKGIYRYTMNYPSVTATVSDIDFNNNMAASLDTSIYMCEVNTIDFQSNGSLVFGGQFTLSGGFSPVFIARVDSLGVLDNTFISTINNYVWSLVVDQSDNIIVTGDFTFPKNGIVFLSGNGSSNNSFNTNLGISANDFGRIVINDKNKKTLVGGFFTSVNSLPANNLVRLHGTQSANAGICLVTVDSVYGQNMLVWNKVPDMHTNIYKIYRETSTNVYSQVGWVPYTNLSVWIDTTTGVNPSIQSNRYKITVVDSNSIEGPMSDSVKTIHLSVSQGINGESNLSWDASEGFAFAKYYIRRSVNGSVYVLIDSTNSSNITSYTDQVPLPIGQLSYVIEAINPNDCTPTVMKMSTNPYGTTQSNLKTVLSTGIISIADVILHPQIYPSPTSGLFTIGFDLQKNSNITMSLINLSGSKIKDLMSVTSISGPKEYRVDISDVAPGFYFLQITTEGVSKNVKVIKN